MPSTIYTVETFPAMTNEQRAAIKSAILNHADFDQDFHIAKPSNEWLKSDIAKLALILNLDVDDIMISAAMPSVTVETPTEETPTEETPEVAAHDEEPDADKIKEILSGVEDLVAPRVFRELEQSLNQYDTDMRSQMQHLQALEIAASNDSDTTPMAQASKPGLMKSFKDAFNISGSIGKQYHQLQITTWRNKYAPAIDPHYVLPVAEAGIILAGWLDNVPAWVWGSASTGKTSLGKQIAAATGRPHFYYSFMRDTDFNALIGQYKIKDGSMEWQDGALVQAIRTPGCVVHLDEITASDAGAHMLLQTLLEERYLTIADTGERVYCAKDVQFIATDNTDGTGDTGLYLGTNQMNNAFRGRFNYVPLERHSSDIIAKIISNRAQVPHDVGTVITEIIERSENAVESSGQLSTSISLRSGIHFANLLRRGVPATDAMQSAIVGVLGRAEQESARQIVTAHGLRNEQWRELVEGKTTLAEINAKQSAATASASKAADDFADDPELTL